MEKNSNEIIHLNVGGHFYSTTFGTVSTSPFFSSMFGGNLRPSSLDSNGRYFIDRNGEAFRVVLEFLRSGRIILIPGLSEEVVRSEFDYYGLEWTSSEEQQQQIFNARMKSCFETSVIPIWIENVLVPFVLNNKKAPFYLERNGLGKFFFTLRGKLGNYFVDSDSFYRIQESKEGYLAFNAHNIDVSRYLMDLLRDFLLRGDEARDIFQQALINSGQFSNVSFKLYSENTNGVETHSLSITAFK